jgi:hypothetical protein
MSTPDHRWELNSQIELRASPIDLIELNLPTIDHDHVSTSFWNRVSNCFKWTDKIINVNKIFQLSQGNTMFYCDSLMLDHRLTETHL